MKRPWIKTLLLLSVALIGYLDFSTPYEYSMELLYFAPMALFALSASMAASSAMATYVAAIWFLADYLEPSSPMPSYPLQSLLWIASVKLGTLWVVTYSLIRAKRAMRARDESQKQLRRLNNELEQRVADRTAKLRENTADMEAFSYSLVHDMRAPLRAMQGYVHLLLTEACADCVKANTTTYLRRLAKAAARMDALIVDALDFSKITRGELPLQPVDVAALLRELIDSYPNLQIHQDHIHLEGEFPLVMGNKAAITQCAANLLGNAIKFVAPGVQPQVRVWAEERGAKIRIWFEDNGIGILEGWEEKIFLMFQQVNKSEAGTGIGLAIVHKAAERMGGAAGVISVPGKGSRFWLDLNQAKAQPTIKPADAQHPKSDLLICTSCPSNT